MLMGEVLNSDRMVVGNMDLLPAIFSIPMNSSIIHDVVVWQLSKRRSGCHKVKDRAEVSGTGKKIYKQKGSGRARHADAQANLFRTGGVTFGPLVRDHGFKVNKKVRRKALKVALSDKYKYGKCFIMDDFSSFSGKTKDAVKVLDKFNAKSSLIVVDADSYDLVFNSISNIPYVDCIHDFALNVYDMLNHDILIFSRKSIQNLQQRLS